jgi:hypothetical protein
MSNRYVETIKISYDQEFLTDMISGNGFLISDPVKFKDISETESVHGPRSTLYGTPLEHHYTCKCGMMSEARFDKLECPYCGGIVEENGVNFSMTGWIDLGRFRIVNPLFYLILETAIGAAVIKEIITKRIVYTKDGNVNEIYYNTDNMKPKKSSQKIQYIDETNSRVELLAGPFSGIGIDGFYDKFEEIMNYYKHKNKSKPAKVEQIDYMLENKYKVFCTKIPIYTTVLRPLVVTNSSINHRPIDRFVNTLVNLSIALKSQRQISIDKVLLRIQEKALDIWKYTCSCIEQKKGYVRSKVLGGPINYVARNVVVLRPQMHADEVEIGYPLFCDMFKYRIIYKYYKKYNVPVHVAEEILTKSYIFNPEIYQIILELLDEDAPETIIIRNPTNNLGSIVKLRIHNVVPSADYYCVGVTSTILGGLTCDFDGDILTIIGVFTDFMKQMFRSANPIDTMMIDKDNGRIRASMNIDESASSIIYNMDKY